MKDIIRISQKIIIVNKNGEILALKRGVTAPSRPGYWDFPGGELEFGENLKEGVIRETKEETGLGIASPEFVDAYAGLNDKKEYWVTICYLAKVDNSVVVKLSSEHDAFKWVKPQELSKLKISPRLIGFIKTFLSK